MKAIWNNRILAESNHTTIVEGNHYFPLSSLNMEFFVPSDRTSHCPWKGDASYFTLVVDGETNPDAAWYYAAPSDAASQIKDHVAFWHGVGITE